MNPKIPLLLLPGLASNERLWQQQAASLSPYASIQILSADQNSPSAMVQAILKQAPAQFALAGHSMGGWLCLEILRVEPRRVLKVCLLNTSARPDTPQKLQKRHAWIQKAEQGLYAKVVEEMVELFVHCPEAKAEAKKMFMEVGSQSFIHQQQAMIQRLDCQMILPQICCPTTIMHAACDRIFSLEEHQEMAACIPGARLAMIENAGHLSPIENPQTVTAHMLDWLLGDASIQWAKCTSK